jgi:hypothetical protein
MQEQCMADAQGLQGPAQDPDPIREEGFGIASGE